MSQNLKERIGSIGNLLKQLTETIDRVNRLEEWRKTKADPQMEDNRIAASDALSRGNLAINEAGKASDLASAAGNVAKEAITTSDSALNLADTSLTQSKESLNIAGDAKLTADNSLSLSELVQREVKNALDKITTNKGFIDDILTKIKDQIEPTIETAKRDINQATIEVQNTRDEAKAIFNKLLKTGDDLKSDSDVIKGQIDDFKIVMESEISKIITAFQYFGQQIHNASVSIVNNTKLLAGELVEARNEIQPTLQNAVTWSKRILSRAKRWDWLGALEAAFVTVKRLLFEGVSRESGPVIPEVLEAIHEISLAFTNLSVAFQDFGIVLKTAPEDLGNTISGTTNAITTQSRNFTGSFQALFDNLSDNLKGLVPSATFTPEPVVLAPIPTMRPSPAYTRQKEEQTRRAQQRRLAEAQRYETRRGGR